MVADVEKDNTCVLCKYTISTLEDLQNDKTSKKEGEEVPLLIQFFD